MKILLIFTFYLISGPVSCFDVTGYSGGSVIIYCTIPENRGYNGYFCKESEKKECVYLDPDKTQNTWDHKGRVSVDEISGFLKVIYRDLSLEDTGVYQCGETGELTNIVKLNVTSDDCCSGPKTVIGYPGETVTISCSYPEELKEKAKFFYKQDFDEFIHVTGTRASPKYTSSKNLKERFSISDNRRSRDISVRISDVMRDDEGDYYCGVSDDEGAANYETFFSKIHLQVTATAPSGTTDHFSVIITVIVVLLLIGGAALVFFIMILKKKQGSTPSASTNQSDRKEVPAVFSNDEETGLTTQTPPKDQEITYSTLNPPKDQELTYSSVSFHKSPGSSTDASVSVNKEEPETEYATVKHPKELE